MPAYWQCCSTSCRAKRFIKKRRTSQSRQYAAAGGKCGGASEMQCSAACENPDEGRCWPKSPPNAAALPARQRQQRRLRVCRCCCVPAARMKAFAGAFCRALWRRRQPAQACQAAASEALPARLAYAAAKRQPLAATQKFRMRSHVLR
ncbi:hypothetical protein NPIL_360231 [Nephila pilipes]|uniref:Uncharacterized protein n=1 Tax=Nephila pilipes TaxID=299642 RepID=A0A8X6TX70_NEPPI|nr:hypothetical protein NPIL_360231 [Nephila pilipes]